MGDSQPDAGPTTDQHDRTPSKISGTVQRHTAASLALILIRPLPATVGRRPLFPHDRFGAVAQHPAGHRRTVRVRGQARDRETMAAIWERKAAGENASAWARMAWGA
ncbi:hypothetical protein GCM10023319_45820 [Nocardia iowensis]